MIDLIEETAAMLQIDKTNWTKVKFGSAAIQQKKSVDREKTDLTCYVKGEHMGSQDLHLREWGELKDEYLGPAFIRYFEKGDILYGSRRTYLRKVVIAPFEGITSNTTLVIKANEKVIDKRFLPFVMMSEGFTDHSIKNSKGSVNPYINWKDLANYEFLLPPKVEQARLAELLWGVDEVIEKEKEVLFKNEVLKKSLVKIKCLEAKGTRQPLLNIIDKLESGVSVNSEEGALMRGEYGILKTSSVSGGFFNATEVKRVKKSEIIRLRTPVKENSIIISRMNTAELVGANGFVDAKYDNLYLPDRLWQTQINPAKFNVKFIWYVLSSPTFRSRISELCTGTSNSMKNISQRSFLGLELTLPSKIDQDEIVAQIDITQSSIESIKFKISASQSLQKSLINQIF